MTTLANLAVQVTNASVIYPAADKPVQALQDVSLDIKEGEFVSFIGPSGCGKTTLMRVIADLESLSSGTVLVNGVSAEQARLKHPRHKTTSLSST